MLGAAIVIVAPRFGFRSDSPMEMLRRKEWTRLRRDPWLVSQTLMQMLYLLPPAFLLWRRLRVRQHERRAADAGPGHGGRAAYRRARLARHFRRGRTGPTIGRLWEGFAVQADKANNPQRASAFLAAGARLLVGLQGAMVKVLP
jgi:hypothetical protein